ADGVVNALHSPLEPGQPEQRCSQRRLQEFADLADKVPAPRREQCICAEPLNERFHFSVASDNQDASLREQRSKQQDGHQPNRAGSVHYSRFTRLRRSAKNGMERNREGVREDSSIESHGLWNRKE